MNSLDQPLPQIAEHRARREAIHRLGKRWTAAHDLYCIKRLFDWELIDANQYAELSETAKNRASATAAQRRQRRAASNLPTNRVW